MRRRTVLATLAATSTSGCLQRARSLANRQSPQRVSVTIKTVPADADEAAIEIARALQENMQAVGIDASIELKEKAAFLRDILLNNDFDIYVGSFPPRQDPDFLRATLHSEFAPEPGWQNPFGITDLKLDDHLNGQRTSDGQERRDHVETVAIELARKRPFDTVCFPEDFIVVRTDRFRNWPNEFMGDPLSYLSIDRADDDIDSNPPGEPVTLRMTLTDNRVTENLNPIAVEYRRRGAITGLVYDSLARRHDGAVRPWLASVVDWANDDDTTAIVGLREQAQWHDGEPLTASDVTFTYRLFNDTTLGDGEISVPAPRFRGRTSLVESVERLDERTARLRFGDTDESVAARALTVPILPKHVWEEKTGSADLAGLDVSTAITEALVWANPEPIGSGPFAFSSRVPKKELVLSRFDGHFLELNPPGWFDDDLAFDQFVVRVAPSSEAAVTLVIESDADLTGGSLPPDTIADVTGTDALAIHRTTSQAFYHVGFNLRRDPFGNVRFRRAIARLLDPQHLVERVFDGYATPTATPLARPEWCPMELKWDGTDPEVPFFGTDGELDVEEATAVFEEAGFRFEDDNMVY